MPSPRVLNRTYNIEGNPLVINKYCMNGTKPLVNSGVISTLGILIKKNWILESNYSYLEKGDYKYLDKTYNYIRWDKTVKHDSDPYNYHLISTLRNKDNCRGQIQNLIDNNCKESFYHIFS